MMLLSYRASEKVIYDFTITTIISALDQVTTIQILVDGLAFMTGWSILWSHDHHVQLSQTGSDKKCQLGKLDYFSA